MGDKHLAGGSFAHGSWSLDFLSGKLMAALSYDSAVFGGSTTLQLKSRAALDELKVLIPGQIDDAVISIVEGVLGV